MITTTLIYRRFIPGLFLTLVFFCSCEKFVEVDPPKNAIASSEIFASDATARSAMAGIYSSMVSSGLVYGGYYGLNCLAGLSADELTNYATSSANFIQFYQNALSPANSDLNGSFWASPYQLIYAANSILEGLNNSIAVSESLRKQLHGEAKFVRAFQYFYLVNLFGAVPIITGTDYNQNAVVGRSLADSVYKLIIADLLDADTSLAPDYSFSRGEKVGPDKSVAEAMLARVYLYRQDWQKAEQYATSVIGNTADYSLTDLNAVFLADSPEAIWQLMPFGFDTQEAETFLLSGAPSNLAISNQLLSAFEDGDLRRTNWVDSIIDGVDTYYFPFKYKILGGTAPVEYSTVLRLSEQYLIRAEARAQQDNISSASDDLNIIRNRAGLSDYNGLADKNSLLAAILHERQVELFTEFGHRWLDLKRTGTVNTVMNSVTQAKGGVWKPEMQLYPIPQVQLQNDPAMTQDQNPGY